jgi:sugar lactone lactonase YvrE
MHRWFWNLLVLGLFLGAAQQVRSDYIYWTDYGSGDIRRANLDGTGQTVIVKGLSAPAGIDLNVVAGQMYWADDNSDIRRANLDGTGQTTLVPRAGDITWIHLDIPDGQMYWTKRGTGSISRANLDGSGVTTLVTGLNGPRGIALDPAGGKMYWTDAEGGDIRIANLDGSGQTTLLKGLAGPHGIALDLSDGKMYWADRNSGVIERANLDGTDQEPLVKGLNSPTDLILDLAHGLMYWSDQFTGGDIRRANLDGTNEQILITGQNLPGGIALDFSPPVSQLQISAPSNATAGSPFDVTVMAVDSNGNVVPGYTGTVAFSSTDPYPAVLPATYTFTATDQGAHTFSGGVTLFTAGTQTLTVQDTATSSLTGSGTVTVGAGASARLVVSAPASAIAGAPFQVTVTVQDTEGNVVTGYTGTVLVTSLELNPQPTDHTFSASDNGSYVFSTTLLSAGVQTVEARDAENGALAGTATVTVQAAPASQLLLTAPATVSSGMPFDVLLTALDQYGNTASNYQGTLVFSTSDANPRVVLPAPYTFTVGNGADNGLHDFAAQVTLFTPGNQTLTTTDTVSGITVSATVTVQ